MYSVIDNTVTYHYQKYQSTGMEIVNLPKSIMQIYWYLSCKSTDIYLANLRV